MSNPHYHALSSVQKFGGDYEAHLPAHSFLDSSKSTIASMHHRAIFHHREIVPLVADLYPLEHIEQVVLQHIEEDTGRVVSLLDWWGDTPSEIQYRNRITPHDLNRAMVNKFGGTFEDYDAINTFMCQFDAEDVRYASILNHTLGIFVCEQKFGVKSTRLPTRIIAEKNVLLKFGKIPTVQDWVQHLKFKKDWQLVGAKKLSEEF